MRKPIAILVIVLIFIASIFSSNPAASYAGNNSGASEDKLKDAIIMYFGRTSAFINNNEVQIDLKNPKIKPFRKYSTYFVPVRFIAETLGATVTWNSKTSTATIKWGKILMKLTKGKSTSTLNNKPYKLTYPVESINNRLFADIHGFADALGLKAFYNDNLIILSKTTLLDEDNDYYLIDNAEKLFIPNISGNTTGNISNMGLVSKQKGWIYYLNPSDGETLYKSRLNGTTPMRLNNDLTGEINVIGDWIYYINAADNNSIYKIKTNGTTRTKLNNHSSSYINVVDNWIYYSNASDGGSIYKMRISGAKSQKLCNDSSLYISVSEDWIYYSNASDGHKLYKIKVDGSLKTKLSDNASFFLNVSGPYIYYSNLSDGGRIYKIKNDGSNIQKINEDKSYFLNVSRGWIYYSNITDSGSLYKASLDGSISTKLSDAKVEFINIADPWIYYAVLSDDNKSNLYKMSIDKLEPIKVE